MGWLYSCCGLPDAYPSGLLWSGGLEYVFADGAWRCTKLLPLVCGECGVRSAGYARPRRCCELGSGSKDDGHGECDRPWGDRANSWLGASNERGEGKPEFGNEKLFELLSKDIDQMEWPGTLGGSDPNKNLG